MSKVRDRVFAAMEEDTDELGFRLNKMAAVSDPDAVMEECRALARQALSGVKLESPEWELELVFGDAVDALALHRLWIARGYRVEQLVSEHNQSFGDSLQVSDFDNAISRGVAASGKANDDGLISLGLARLAVRWFATSLAEAWAERGGAKIRGEVMVPLLVFCSLMPDWVDQESTFGYDEQGFPRRLVSEALAAEFEDSASMRLLDEVRGKLPFTLQPWDGFDPVQLAFKALEWGLIELSVRVNLAQQGKL